jgi:hypothetical protein
MDEGTEIMDYMNINKSTAIRRMPSSGILRRIGLVGTDVSKKRIDSVIRVTRIGELGKTLVTANVTSQKTEFFVITAVKTSSLSFFSKI